jgi:hypothetical protein
MYFLLTYDLTADYLIKREAFRDAHIKYAMTFVEQGSLCLGGALQSPASQALLVFKGKNSQVVKDFAKQDPYVLNGLITEWRVNEWNIVLGLGINSVAAPK